MDTRLMKPIRGFPKPLLLKDHLLDDMSSCSSNGFKSFPRRQCCTTVRFLHDTSDRRSKLQHRRIDHAKPPPKSALSALITAVKRLPFGGARKKSGINSFFLPRSFSKRMFRKGGFWKRKPERKEIVSSSIERWKSFDQLLKEDSRPSDRSITTTDDTKSYGWSGSDFTASDGGNSSSEVNSNLPDARNDAVRDKVDDHKVEAGNDDVSAASTTSSDGSSITNSSNETKKQWRNDQEKEEQLSPVCVLDCPFEEEEEDEVSSPFRHRLARMEGTRKKLLKKIQRFECLAKLEPVNLTTRFRPQTDSDDESSDSPLPHSSSSINEEHEQEKDEDEEENSEEKAVKLLDQVKANMSSYGLKLNADNLMLEFFRESIASDLHCTNLEKQRDKSSFYEELVEIAEDWLDGREPRESVFKEWEVEKNRQAYVEDMEKGGEWKRLDQENEEVALELGNEVFAALLNEMLLDIIRRKDACRV